MHVNFEQASILARMFSPEYFVVVAMRPDGNLGRGRYELRKAELRLAREFAL